MRKQYGPVPYDNGEVLALMAERGLLEIKTLRDSDGEMPGQEYKASKAPDRNAFMPDELEVIERGLSEYSGVSTGQLVRLSHDLVWANREDGEEIKFEAYLRRLNLTPNLERKMRAAIEAAELAYEE